MSDFTPHVETREISDSDLDNVSGGLLGVVTHTVNTVEGVVPSPSGVLNQVTGALPAGVTGNGSVAFYA